MKFDLHTHHERCGHAVGQIEQYIEAAIAGGLDVIGISDHSPFFGSDEEQLRPDTAMGKSEFANYVKEVLDLKEKYKDRIEVLLGVESDFFPEHMELYRSVYQQYPLDYIIGSVHISNEKSIFDRHRWDGLSEEDIVREKDLYHDLIQQSARSGMFDILGHMDAMKSNFPRFTDIVTPSTDETLKVIAECDVAIEVNTSGKIKPCADWHPTNEILERAYHYGVKISFGSDAHRPERVGDEWDLVRKRLKEIGFKDWVFYRQRKRQVVPL